MASLAVLAVGALGQLGCSGATAPEQGPLVEAFSGHRTMCLPLEPGYDAVALTAAAISELTLGQLGLEDVPSVHLLEVDYTTDGAQATLHGLERNPLMPPAVFGVPLREGSADAYLQGQGHAIDEPGIEATGDAALLLLVRPKGDGRFRRVSVTEVDYRVGNSHFSAPLNVNLFFVESSLEDWDHDCGPEYAAIAGG